MTCLIRCVKGCYQCTEGKDGMLAGFTVNNDPLILKAANLPPTEILCQVDKEYVPSGYTIGGDVTCVVLRKPGCYKLSVSCADYEGEAPPEGERTEICYVCDPNFDSLAALAEAVAVAAGGEPAPIIVDVSAIVDKLCEIFGVPAEGEPNMLEKLCEMATSLTTLIELFGEGGTFCDKINSLIATLTTEEGVSAIDKLCEMSLCLTQIKANTAAITGIETSLGQVGCVKDEQGNITGSVLVCKVSDTTTSPPTDTIKVWLFNTDGSVVEDYDGPYEGCTSLTELRDLLEAILKCPKPLSMQCVQKPVRCIGYDNGRTPGSSTNDGGLAANFVRFNWAFTLKSWTVNGVEKATGQAVGPYAGWTEQLQGWADVMNAAMGEDAPKCNAAFGFLPAPTWRYTKITCNDPDTSFGPMVLERDDGVCFTIYPILETVGSEKLQRYSTVDCDGVKNTVWCDMEGNVVEAPADAECYIDCAIPLSAAAEGLDGPDCTTLGTQRVCNGTIEGDQAIMVTLDCNGVIERTYYTAESWADGNPEEVEDAGTIDWVDCITGDPIPGLPATLDDFKEVKPATGDQGTSLTYTNSDNTTEMTASFGTNGDIKISSGGGDGSDDAITAYITACLAAGNDVDLTMTGLGGETGSVTLLAAAQTNPFPGFYNQSTNGVSTPANTAFKVGSMTASCKADVGELVCFLRTTGCNDDRRDTLLADLLAKQCDGLVDCEICVTLTVPDGAVVASFDATGLEEVIDPPANTVAELAVALQQAGYTVDSVVGNTLTVCGAKLISAIKLEGGELVLSQAADAKQGQLVCDPNTRALLAQNADIKALLQANNTLLAELVSCLCGPKDEDQCSPPFNVLNGSGESEFVPFGDAGPDQEWPAPVPNDNAIFGGVGFKLQAAYPECAKGTLRVKLALDHETSGGLYNNGTGGHNGFYISPSAGSWVTGSGTNGAAVNSATSAVVRQDGASPFGTDRSIRCLEIDVTPAELAAGIDFNFAAFGSVGVGGEMLHSVTPTIVNSAGLDCSACTVEEIKGATE